MMIGKFNTAMFKKKAVLLEQLEIQKAIADFAISLAVSETIDDMFMDVTANCISRLGFTDCALYLLDERSDTLVLKAASSDGGKLAEIAKPVEIPLGQGIAGCVALKGISEIVRDTSTDDRYIQYHEPRLSEIVVPIVLEEKVIGVIDSDHPHKNYFKPRHLRVLNTVASLCAAKIGRLKLV